MDNLVVEVSELNHLSIENVRVLIENYLYEE